MFNKFWQTMDSLLTLLPGAVCIIVMLLYNFWKTKFNHSVKSRSPPEPPGAWPFIGHLHLLGSEPTMARTLGRFADIHGPIFTIKLGKDRALVVSNWEAVKECFTINDKSFATRPPSTNGKLLSYNYAGFSFAPDGPYWREIRKLISLHVLSGKRLEALKHVRVSEIDTNIKELYAVFEKNGDDYTPAKVVISTWIESLTLNVIVKTIAGKRYVNRVDGVEDEEAKKFKRVIKEFMYEAGQLVVSDFISIPFIKWIDIGGNIKSMKKISKELDEIIQRWINEHIERRMKSETAGDHGEDQDFVDVLLSVIDGNITHGHKRETVIKATVMTIILGAAETTSIVLTWVFSLLTNNERVMEKAKKEIEITVGTDRLVEESDIKNLNYLQAIIKETLRLYPPAPLSVTHQAKEDVEVNGYLIPKGTHLFVNLWKLHRDPRIWSEPDEFQPERFVIPHTDVDVFGHHFEYVPFGSGRRACPGIGLAMPLVHLIAARLLQGFEFTTLSNLPVDMTEGQGLTLPKETPLQVMIKPRLSASMY